MDLDTRMRNKTFTRTRGFMSCVDYPVSASGDGHCASPAVNKRVWIDLPGELAEVLLQGIYGIEKANTLH